jgi:hypothetical protein
MAKRPLLIALGVFVVVAAILWIPWATKDRVVGSTPVPPPLFGITPVPLKGGSTACLDNVTFSPQTDIGEIGVTTKGKPGPRLDITASAPGYHVTSQISAGYSTDPAARFPIASPPGAVIGKLCIHNAGKTAISLNGTNEFRTMGRPTLVVDGAPQPVDAKLVFYDRVHSSYVSRLGSIFGHAAIFTPGFFSKVVLMLLALLALVGIPLAVALALSIALRED